MIHRRGAIPLQTIVSHRNTNHALLSGETAKRVLIRTINSFFYDTVNPSLTMCVVEEVIPPQRSVLPITTLHNPVVSNGKTAILCNYRMVSVAYRTKLTLSRLNSPERPSLPCVQERKSESRQPFLVVAPPQSRKTPNFQPFSALRYISVQRPPRELALSSL